MATHRQCQKGAFSVGLQMNVIGFCDAEVAPGRSLGRGVHNLMEMEA